MPQKKIIFYTSIGINNIPDNQKIEFYSLNQILEIKKKQFNKIKNKCTKFIYNINERNNETKIFGKVFTLLNYKKAYLIINNKRNNLINKINNGEE